MSRSVYDNNPTNVQVGDSLPPGCVPVNCQPANSDGTYPFVWNNDLVDTVSGNGDEGADPNQLVMITDTLSASTLPAGESFKVVRQAGFGEVLRGVSFTPGTLPSHDH